MSPGRKLIQIGDMAEYLRCTDVVDYDEPSVAMLAATLRGSLEDVIREAFVLVRDRVPHSMDAVADGVPCSASETLSMGHGLCYAKSHLLAALLRYHGIPAGFCYQRLAGEQGPVLHSLNAVHANGKWRRIDARGNNGEVNVVYSPEVDLLAFEADAANGERDYLIVFPLPDPGVVKILREGAGSSPRSLTLPGDLSCPL
jgi:transglutaminase-like putative cysteine protease